MAAPLSAWPWEILGVFKVLVASAFVYPEFKFHFFLAFLRVLAWAHIVDKILAFSILSIVLFLYHKHI